MKKIIDNNRIIKKASRELKKDTLEYVKNFMISNDVTSIFLNSEIVDDYTFDDSFVLTRNNNIKHESGNFILPNYFYDIFKYIRSIKKDKNKILNILDGKEEEVKRFLIKNMKDIVIYDEEKKIDIIYDMRETYYKSYIFSSFEVQEAMLLHNPSQFYNLFEKYYTFDDVTISEYEYDREYKLNEFIKNDERFEYLFDSQELGLI